MAVYVKTWKSIADVIQNHLAEQFTNHVPPFREQADTDAFSMLKNVNEDHAKFAHAKTLSLWSFRAYTYFAGGEADPPHGQGCNILFCDGHVVFVKRSDNLYPPRSASNRNSDHQPHPETWTPVNLWTVQN